MDWYFEIEHLEDPMNIEPEPEEVAKTANLRVQELEAALKEKEDVLKQKETDFAQITKEFMDLDEYANKLQDHLEQLQHELNQRSVCPSCGYSFVRETEGC